MEFLVIGLIIAVLSQMGEKDTAVAAKDEAVAEAKTQRDKREATIKRQLDARRATQERQKEQAEIDKKVADGIAKGLAAAPPVVIPAPEP